jgi:hypothetical protein
MILQQWLQKHFPLEGNGLASYELDQLLAQVSGRPWLVAGP